MRKNLKYFSLFIFAIVAFSSCKDDESQELIGENPEVVDNTPILSQLLTDTNEFTLFNEAAEITGINALLEDINTNVTLFAPTNEALQNFINSNPEWNSLSDINPPLLRRVLSQHVIAGNISSDVLSAEMITSAISASEDTEGANVRNSLALGVNVAFTKSGDDISVSNGTFETKVTEANSIVGINGTVHTVDTVLDVVLAELEVGVKGLEETENGTVLINLTEVPGEITDAAASDFTIQIENPQTGFTTSPTVTEVNFSDVNPNQIVLTISEPIINTDIVKISYAGGSILSIGQDELEAFTDEIISPYFVNVIPDDVGSFEGTGNLDNPQLGFQAGRFWSDGYNGIIKRSTDRSFSGSASLSYEGDPSTDNSDPANPDNVDGGPIVWFISFFSAEEGFIPTTGKYAVSIRVFIEEGSELENITTAMRQAPPNQVFDWDVSNIEKGKWITLPAQVVDINEITPFAPNVAWNQLALYVRGVKNPSISGVQKVYVDDIIFAPLETR